MGIIYTSFSLRQKFEIWILRLIISSLLILTILHFSKRPFLISIIAIVLITFIIIINDEKIVVYEDRFIIRKLFLFNLYRIDKVTIYYKDIIKLETDNRNIIDKIISGFRNMRGSNLYIYFKNDTNKILKTEMNYSEICKIVQIINNKIGTNELD